LVAALTATPHKAIAATRTIPRFMSFPSPLKLIIQYC
jgi:hypothetical protein